MNKKLLLQTGTLPPCSSFYGLLLACVVPDTACASLLRSVRLSILLARLTPHIAARAASNSGRYIYHVYLGSTTRLPARPDATPGTGSGTGSGTADQSTMAAMADGCRKSLFDNFCDGTMRL